MNTKRLFRRLTKASVLALLLNLFPGFSMQARSDERPNVVWIISDDLSPELGCYGYEGVSTPNVDRLASEGVRYTNAFSTAPVCSTSRSAFITGVYQISTGTHHHRTLDKRPLPSPVKPITETLRQAGYFVCNGDSSLRRAGKGDYNFSVDGKMYDGVDWTVAKNGRKKGQPFFAQVQIHEPHRDFVRAKNPRRADTVEIPTYYPEHPVVRVDWANYLETVEVMDRKVGAVLDRLEQEGLAENTWVFFFGDHGRPHYRDKQWLYDGGIRVPLIVRAPQGIDRGRTQEHLVSLIDVSAATLGLAGVKIPEWMDGRNMLAADFTGRDSVYACRDRAGSTLDRVRAVRTPQFKYIRNYHPERPYSQHSGYKVLQYPGLTAARVLSERGQLSGPPSLFWSERRPEEELYDVIADPEEIHNLASDDRLADTLAQLRNKLDRWVESSDDQGRFPEKNVEATAESSDSWFRGRMKKRGFKPSPDPELYLDWWKKELGL